MNIEPYLVWAIAGFVLVIAELLTGTFYLLVLGVAGLVAAVVAFLGGGFAVQCILAGAAALFGTWCVHKWAPTREDAGAPSSNDLDLGQAVVLESFTDRAAGLVRVQYRGASWDAQLEGDAQERDTLFIRGRLGSRFVVGAAPPA